MFDVLPTFAKLGGGKVPADRKIDGGDIWPVLAGAPGAKSPHEVFYFFRGMKLEGVRSGPWKLRLAAAAEPAAPEPANAQRSKVKAGEDQLYNLEADIGESKNVAAEHPDVMKRLRTLVDAMQDDLGIKDSGPGVRPLGRVANPQPLIGKDGKIRDGFGASTKTDNTSGQAIKPAGTRADTVIGAFEEKDWGGWTASGTAFPPAPYRPGDNKRFAAFEGAGIAWSGRVGVESVGTLLSPAFQIQRRFINFLVAGARDLPAKLGVELLVEGKGVRATSASEANDPSRALYWRTWDVRDLAGRTARIRVNDQSATGGIAVDSFSQSDTAQGRTVGCDHAGSGIAPAAVSLHRAHWLVERRQRSAPLQRSVAPLSSIPAP